MTGSDSHVNSVLIRVALVAILAFALVVPSAAASELRGVDPLGTSEVHRVRMVDGNRFRPARITIPRGDRVRWVNRDNVTHTTTSESGTWNETLAPGEGYSRRFRRAGTFQYRCTIHLSSGMTGTIVVT
jgi:plastocyanin